MKATPLRKARWIRFLCPGHDGQPCPKHKIEAQEMPDLQPKQARREDVLIEGIRCAGCDRLHLGLPYSHSKRPRKGRKIPEKLRENEPRNAGDDQRVYFPTSI